MFQVVVRGFNLPSSVAVGDVGLGAHLFYGNLPVEKKGNLLGKCLWEPVKGDTVDAALRGWAFNNSVTGLGNIRPGSLYSQAELNIQPSLQWEASLIKTLSPADFISASSDRSSLLQFFLLFLFVSSMVSVNVLTSQTHLEALLSISDALVSSN